jgi:hypothetical protein
MYIDIENLVAFPSLQPRQNFPLPLFTIFCPLLGRHNVTYLQKVLLRLFRHYIVLRKICQIQTQLRH